MDILFIVAAALSIMCASLIGVVSVWRHLGTFIERHLTVLVSFSAGVFLIVAYELAHEVLAESATVGVALAWIIAGAGGVFLFARLFPAFHHHHDTDCDECVHEPIDARRTLIGDAVHNVGDGILLVSAFAVSVPLGVATTASVFIHELVQETSEFFVLRQAGYRVARALLVNFTISATILIGALGGYYLLETFQALELPLLGIAAGAFFVVVMHDLIPQSVRVSHTRRQYGRHLAWFLAGLALMLAVSTLAAAHSHGEEHAASDSDELHEHEHADEATGEHAAP